MRIETVLASFEGLTGEYRIEINQPDYTDRLTIVSEGEADVNRLRAALGDRLPISPDEVQLVDDLDESGIVGNRY